MAQRKPYSRDQFNRALILNALTAPFNVVLLAVLLIVALTTTAALYPVAAVAYLAAATRTYFDKDAADRVLTVERRRHAGKGRAQLDETTLSPSIARLVTAARERETRIRAAIEAAELPYDEIAGEVDRFVAAMEASARRAQGLVEALHDSPPDPIRRRLTEIDGDPEKAELREALQVQLTTQERMKRRLARFKDEMERILVELDTIRGQIVSVGATTDAEAGRQLAGEVRALREQMGAVADGMAEAYEATQ